MEIHVVIYTHRCSNSALTDLMETEKIARIHCAAMDPGGSFP